MGGREVDSIVLLPLQAAAAVPSSHGYGNIYSKATSSANKQYLMITENVSSLDVLWGYTILLLVSLAVFVAYLLIPKAKQPPHPHSTDLNVSLPHHQHHAAVAEKGNAGTQGGFGPYRDNTMTLREQENERRRERLCRAEAAAALAAKQESQRLEALYDKARKEAAELKLQGSPAAQSNPKDGADQVNLLASPHGPSRGSQRQSANASALAHPSRNHDVPATSVLQRNLEALLSSGVRLIAHGVLSPPKNVHVWYSSATHTLRWRTIAEDEDETESSKPSGNAVRNIPLSNVMYVDVGQKTSAFLQHGEEIASDTCFSLLTARGSLDLQTRNKVERDALVSCFSLLLDQVHAANWRLLYEETASSAAAFTMSSGSSTGTGVGSGVGTAGTATGTLTDFSSI